MKKVIMGNHALSWGAQLGRAQVIAAYPIPPQTQVVELLSEMCASKTLDVRVLHDEQCLAWNSIRVLPQDGV